MAVTTPIRNGFPASTRSSEALYREMRVQNILLAEILNTLKQMLGPAIYNPGIGPDVSADAANWRNDPSFGA